MTNKRTRKRKQIRENNTEIARILKAREKQSNNSERRGIALANR